VVVVIGLLQVVICCILLSIGLRLVVEGIVDDVEWMYIVGSGILGAFVALMLA
jgi:hypothetical protein